MNFTQASVEMQLDDGRFTGAVLFDNHGANTFEGEWIQFGTDPFRDWEAVLKYLNA